MLISFIFCLVIVINISEISCRCAFQRFNPDYPPVFTQKFEAGEIVLKKPDQQLFISEGGFLTAYCDSNFSTPLFRRSESEGVSAVNVKCSRGNIYYESVDEDDLKQEASEELVCYGGQPGLYSTDSENCGSYGRSVAYGLTVGGKQILLSTFCYNIEMEEIVHINYKSSEHSFVLQDTRYGGNYLNPNEKITLNLIGSKENRTDELNSFLRRHSNYLSDIDLFRFDELVPGDRLAKNFAYQWDLLEGMNSIPWSINLKDGNWKLFEQLLEKEILVNDYTIYTGIAHNYQVEKTRSEKEQRDRERALQKDLELKRQRELELQLQQEKARKQAEEERERERTRGYQPLPAKRPRVLSVIPPRVNEDFYNTSYERPFSVYNPYSASYNRRSRSAKTDNLIADDIRYVSESVVKSIPLYVWTYLKSPAGDSNSTVVMGINSPFVEVSKFYKLDFCHEQCPSWLDELSTTARIPSLGYMFCCRPEVAREYIPTMPM